MHVSPAKHSYMYVWLPRKCDYPTDRRQTKWSLCATMLCRRHKNFKESAWSKFPVIGKLSYFWFTLHIPGPLVVYPVELAVHLYTASVNSRISISCRLCYLPIRYLWSSPGRWGGKDALARCVQEPLVPSTWLQIMLLPVFHGFVIINPVTKGFKNDRNAEMVPRLLFRLLYKNLKQSFSKHKKQVYIFYLQRLRPLECKIRLHEK